MRVSVPSQALVSLLSEAETGGDGRWDEVSVPSQALVSLL